MTVQPIDQHNYNKEIKGILFDIQRFSVNDGPGIRTNLFFKGCPLRCKWCHNPESYRPGRQLSFQPSACTGCMACVLACTRGVNQAVREGGRELLAVDYSRCAACGECLKVCCYDARSIIGREYTARELNEKILVDRAYYQVKDEEGNTGGVTLTGGEPMSQFPFVERLLDELDGIHVCMETSGFAPEEQFARLLGKVDLFLFDYKATDPEKHREFCGVDNRLIQSNLKFLCDHGADIILRLPLIAGLNDDEAHFKAVAGLVERYPNIRRAEIMAYHNLGVSKADQIGMAGELWDQENTSAKQKEVWLRRFKDLGLTKIKIG